VKPCVEMVPWRPQGRDGIAKLLPLCAFLFMGLMYREVLMDITDEAGDREAGVRTIPVVAGAVNSNPAAWTCGVQRLAGVAVSMCHMLWRASTEEWSSWSALQDAAWR